MQNRFRIRLAILLSTMSLGVALWILIFDPYSRFSYSMIISAHRISKNEFILFNYADRLETKHKFFREQGEPSSGLPENFKDYLIGVLRGGTRQERESVVRFYSKVLPFTFGGWQVAKYEEKMIIGDVLQLAKAMSDEEKYGALKLVESLRLNRALFRASLGIEKPQTTEVLELYEVWWQAPRSLKEKLDTNPLDKSAYSWSEI